MTLPTPSTDTRPEQLILEKDGVQRRHLAIRREDTLYLYWEGELHRVTRFDPVIAAGSGHDSQGGLSAPMNGSVVRILVTPGQTVAAGAALVVLEAMKMEHSLRAPRDGVVKSLFCQEGDMVKEGSVLVALE